MKHKYFIKVFTIGATMYSIVEIIWRGYTHWSMTITGGVCFSFLNKTFLKMKQCHIFKKCFCGMIIITATEFISGLIFNKLLKLKVWDYSKKFLNIGGQICPLYAFLWFWLCVPVSLFCNLINKKT